MKFRSTAIYFLVLLVIAGAYAAMRVEKEKAARKEKQSRLVFSFKPETVAQIEIERSLSKAISLKKTNNKWTIASPIVSDVDHMQLTGLLSTLHHAEMVRQIGAPSGNLKAFGLDKPSLVVRFLTGGKWLELQAGAENPAQTSWYARTSKNGQVFLISTQTYDNLNKSLTQLRRKELFSWAPRQVKEFQIKWSNGDQLDLARQGGTSIWKSKSQPDLKISADKVDDLLQGLHWLRASNFLANGAMAPSPDLDVICRLKDGQTRELKVALPKPGEKQAVATSSEVPCPVLLSTYFLASIPHSAASLVDRALASNPSDIKKLTWKTAQGGGDLVRMGGDSWGKVEGAGAPKALKDPWPVESFLAFLHNAEYISGSAHPGVEPPQGAPNSIQITDVFNRKSSLAWNAVASKETGPVNAWLEKDGSVQEVQVEPRDIQRIGGLLAHMSKLQ